MKRFSTAILAACAALPVHAADGPGHTGFVAGGALGYGGDKIATVLFSDGSTQNINAGQGVEIDAGLHHWFADSPIDVRGTVGYKYVTTKAQNVDIHLSRVPMDLIATYHFEHGLRAGVGLSHHASIKLDGGGIAPNLAFKPANGLALEFGWKYVVARATLMDYTDEFGGKYNANSFGVNAFYQF